MSEPSETPRPRMNAATLEQHRHEEAMAEAARRSEPNVSVEYTDAAKGEVRAITKVWAPLGCDMAALTEFATELARIASHAHLAANLRTGPIDQATADTLKHAVDAKEARRPRSARPVS